MREKRTAQRSRAWREGERRQCRGGGQTSLMPCSECGRSRVPLEQRRGSDEEVSQVTVRWQRLRALVWRFEGEQGCPCG